MFRYNISNVEEDNVFLRIYLSYYGKHIALPRYSIKIAFTYDTLKAQPTLEAYIDTYLKVVGNEFMRVLSIELEDTNFSEICSDIKKEILSKYE